MSKKASSRANPKPATKTKGGAGNGPPRAHIVRNEDEDAFLKEVNEFLSKGYRPVQEMRAFAAFDRKAGSWKTLYLMPLVHYEELKAFQAAPTPEDDEEEERMYG